MCQLELYWTRVKLAQVSASEYILFARHHCIWQLYSHPRGTLLQRNKTSIVAFQLDSANHIIDILPFPYVVLPKRTIIWFNVKAKLATIVQPRLPTTMLPVLSEEMSISVANSTGEDSRFRVLRQPTGLPGPLSDVPS